MGAWSPHPCGSHPANPQYPAFDSFTRLMATAAVGGCRPLVGTSVGYRMSSSTHGVALLRQAVGRCRPWSTRFFSQISNFIWGQSPLRSNGIRPRALADRGKLSKAGWVRLRGCERHGCRDQAYRDVFTAPPSTGPTPPTLRKPAFDVEVAGQRPALQQVQGCKPCRTTLTSTAPAGCCPHTPLPATPRHANPTGQVRGCPTHRPPPCR